ncbi:MAG TPA: hypothetical protein VGJ84_05635, partial [Polyangiaceae bacterium]
MSTSILDADALRRALSISDLTDPQNGPHALSLMVELLASSLAQSTGARLVLRRATPIVSIADNYDRLRYPPDGAARDARYSRYVCETALLRTHTSAMIPPLLMEVARASDNHLLLACPGLVYRRDSIDRNHVGEPHQIDLWRIRKGSRLGPLDLVAMIDEVAQVALPGWRHRVTPAVHPYTEHGLQIDVEAPNGWLEIGECGVAHPAVLADSGLDPAAWSGLAMGVGLDRLVMLRKGIDDIRLLRSRDRRIASQMGDLSPYRPVSSM